MDELDVGEKRKIQYELFSIPLLAALDVLVPALSNCRCILKKTHILKLNLTIKS